MVFTCADLAKNLVEIEEGNASAVRRAAARFHLSIFVIDKEGVVRHAFSSQLRFGRHVTEALEAVRRAAERLPYSDEGSAGGASIAASGTPPRHTRAT